VQGEVACGTAFTQGLSTRYRLRLSVISIQDKASFSIPESKLPWQPILWAKSGPIHTTATRDAAGGALSDSAIRPSVCPSLGYITWMRGAAA